MFSAKHSFADMRERKKKKTKIGVVCQNGKRCFFGPFWGFGGFVFLVSLCFCASVLYTIARNGYFLAFLEVFCLFCSHKRPVLNCLFSSYFVFCFCLPFQKSIFFFAFCPSTPFRKDSLWGFFCFSFACLFLMFACLFETNFPNIPFFKPKLLSLLAIYFFFCCSCFCFHGVCFSLSVSMLALFLVFCCFHLCFCFCLVACFAFSL